MNILVISDFNIGGQCTALAKAINQHTNHQARCIIAYDDHFAYDRDIILTKDNLSEAADLANSWADFYHFGSYIFNWPGVDFNKLIKKTNCCIKYYGSYLRENPQRCRNFHERSGIAAITGTDFTITGLLPNSYYHLGSYFTEYGNTMIDSIPRCREWWDDGGIFRICAGSAGHPMKGYSILEQSVNELKAQGYNIELDIISGVSNKECLGRKLECHACFCSLSGGWGISGVESMFMGQPTLTLLDPFVLSLYPDQPSVIVDRDNLKEKIVDLMDYREWGKRSFQSFEFATGHFMWFDIAQRYIHLIDLIRHRDEYLAGGKKAEVR